MKIVKGKLKSVQFSLQMTRACVPDSFVVVLSYYQEVSTQQRFIIEIYYYRVLLNQYKFYNVLVELIPRSEQFIAI